METKEAEGDKNMFHFIKINFFGDSGVGKSTFISVLKDKNFEIQNKSDNSLDDSIEISENLVEQKVEKVIVQTSDNKNIPFLIYETNLNYFDTIKANLDTLLIQTECIIIIWDNSNSNTFQNIPNFVKAIISMIKENKLGNINIFLIQNKANLEFDISKEGESEKEIIQKISELKRQYENIFDKKISNKNDMISLLYDIDKRYNTENIKMKLVKIPHPLTIKNGNIGNVRKELKIINICLIGDSKTGKTTFLKEIEFDIEDNQKEIEINYVVEIEDYEFIIKISDTSGNLLNKNFIDTIYKGCGGFLLFFDVTDKETFNSLQNWERDIKNKSNGEIIIIANKIDERTKRVVDKGTISQKYKNYFECSCTDGINVNEIFNEIALIAHNEVIINRTRSFHLCNQIIDELSKSGNNDKSGSCCK